MQTASHGLADSVKLRPVVAGNDQLELRAEFEVVLAHEIGAQFFAAGDRLDARLGPGPPGLGFRHQDQPRRPQAGEFGKVPCLTEMP